VQERKKEKEERESLDLCKVNQSTPRALVSSCFVSDSEQNEGSVVIKFSRLQNIGNINLAYLTSKIDLL